MSDTPQPKVGVGVLVVKEGKVLLGKRKGSHGEGEYALPGGHLEHLESVEECARREVLEETGMTVGALRFLCVVNLHAYAPKHYVEIGLVAEWISGEPEVKEPDRCEGWAWYAPEALPAPLFAAVSKLVESYRTGRAFWDA